MGINLLFEFVIGKRKTKEITIIFLIFYMFITGFSPSVTRASIMYILMLMASLLHRRTDMATSISLSLILILIYNPFLIQNIGLQFSYIGTIGIILLNKHVLSILKNIRIKNSKYKYIISKRTKDFLDKTKEILAVTMSAQISILPIMIYHFNIFGTYFLISNLLVSVIIAPIIILGFITIFVSIISKLITKIICISILNTLIQLLILISDISNLPFSKIYMKTPKVYNIIIYYCLIFVWYFLYQIYNSKQLNQTQRRIRNVIALAKYKAKLKQNKYIAVILCVSVIFATIKILPQNLEIHFVDVGQGDCTFITTPNNKTILIDGGGSALSNFDIGKRILIPYILDRGYTKIDYVIISHTDFDHVGRLDFANARI